MSDGKRFEGMTAVVTGGASGIGLGVAKRIAAEGGRVTIWDQDPARLKAAVAEVGAASARADEVNVADPSSVERATLAAAGEMGHIDILVCSAGVAGKNALVIDYPIDEWKRVFDINVHGLFYCNRFVSKLMKHRGYGRIVNIASIAGKEGNPTASAYSASKAAVIGLTKSLGKELAKDGVCVNTITPATIDTPILSQVSDAHIAYMRSKIPMERFGTVEEATAIVCWLVESRMLVHHWSRLRSLGRPRHLLTRRERRGYRASLRSLRPATSLNPCAAWASWKPEKRSVSRL